MTAEEKAKELVSKMQKDFQYFASKEISKQHALIAVDEMIEALGLYGQQNYELQNMDRTLSYYDNVKQEIEKL